MVVIIDHLNDFDDFISFLKHSIFKSQYEEAETLIFGARIFREAADIHREPTRLSIEATQNLGPRHLEEFI